VTNNRQAGVSEPRRILISAALNVAGGVETHLQQLCQLLVHHGADVTLVARAAARKNAIVRDLKHYGVRLITNPFSPYIRLFQLSTTYALASLPVQLRRRSFDVLYTVGVRLQEVSRFTHFLAYYVKQGGHIIANPVSDTIGRHLVHGSSVLTGLIGETPRQAYDFRRDYRINVPVAAIPHLGFAFTPPARKAHTGGELRVAMIARLEKAKGIYRLLELWPRLNIQPAKLQFLGSGSQEMALRDQIRRRGLSQQVQVSNYTSEQVDNVFANIDLVVLPSAGEGLPLALLEAMAYGVPFVATQVGVVSLLAEGNPDVRAVPADDISLREAIEEMARAIRSGYVRPERLQEYHRSRYGYEQLSKRWFAALIDADDFWRDGGGILPERINEPRAHATMTQSARQ
jgi:glycosyltransferase involved in cell wall biosynthesis